MRHFAVLDMDYGRIQQRASSADHARYLVKRLGRDRYCVVELIRFSSRIIGIR